MNSGMSIEMTFGIVFAICILTVIIVIIILSISTFVGVNPNEKSLDFNYLLEQEYISSMNSINRAIYEKSPSFIKVKLLENFRSKNPKSIQKVNELVAFNRAKYVSSQVSPAVKGSSVSESNKDLMFIETVARTISIPFSSAVETAKNKFEMIQIYPVISIGPNRNSIIVNLNESIMRTIDSNFNLSKLDKQSKDKLYGLLKEKIISDISSNYKKASVGLANDIVFSNY